MNTTQDYRELYLKELNLNAFLKRELEITKASLRRYSEEVKGLFQFSRKQRHDLVALNMQLVKYASDLGSTIAELREAHAELQEAYLDTIFRLALASEYKDKDTGNHISRISRYCALLAEKLGCSKKEIEDISYASPMHDVGKIGIPDHIILKKGKLSEDEFSIVKTHTTIGSAILDNARGMVLKNAQIIALNHHERWDGNGYPQGKKGTKIPLMARIVSVVDTFDALTSRRPYKEPYPIDISCEIIKREKGKQFDPEIVDVFVNHIDDFVNIKKEIDVLDPATNTSKIILSDRDKEWNEKDFVL